MVISNLTFLYFFSIIVMLFILIIYFKNERLNNSENRIYKLLLITNFIVSIFQLVCENIAKYYIHLPTFFSHLIFKLDLMLFLAFAHFLLVYLSILIFKTRKKIDIFTVLAIVMECLSIIFLPLYCYSDVEKNIYYSYGAAVDFTYIITIIISNLIFLMILFGGKKVKKVKFSPLLVYIFLGLISVLIQTVHREIVISAPIETILCLIMYFTIENPDLKMLREFQEAKDYAEKSNNEKTMFLYDMSQKVKIPVTRILRQSENILKDSNDELVNEEAGDIKYYSKKLLQVVDNVLDISNLERYDFQLINSTYNIELLLKEIEIMTRKSIIEKDIDFRCNISSSLPKLIYGDSIRLKQIINIVLDNAIKYTDKGFIEFTVNSVIKHDVCRLIITVEDSGVGMSNEKVEEIFDKERMLDEKNITKIDTEKANLAIASSLAKIIGGAILVSSEIGRGTNVTIVLDQKISEEYKTNMEKNAEEYYEQMTKEKVLVVGMELDKKTKQVLNKMDLVVEEVDLGIDCLNRVRNGLKYKKIIMSEKMDKLDGMTVFKKLQEVSNFNIPVVMVGEEENRQILAKYKEEGISEYVNKVTKDNITELMK